MKNLIKSVTLIVFVTVLASGCASEGYVASTPAEPVYVTPARPNSRVVWVDGEWVCRGGRYQYSQGYWAAPRRESVWVKGYWRSTPRGYVWQKGHWSR